MRGKVLWWDFGVNNIIVHNDTNSPTFYWSEEAFRKLYWDRLTEVILLNKDMEFANIPIQLEIPFPS